jgi:GTP-binding protein
MKREELELPEAAKERRERLFVLYPGLTEDKQQHEVDRMSELAITLLGEERREAMRRLQRPLLELDFDKLPADQENGTVPEAEKVLILQGGQGGYGNPYFTALDVRRAPKIATRGKPGEVMRLELELKTLADIGLVGLPNAGKR